MSESLGHSQGALMEEGRRQAYLAALGVDLYAARQPLPHAAPSWFPEWEVEALREDDPSVAYEESDGEASLSSASAPWPDEIPPAGMAGAVRPAIEALTSSTSLTAAAQRAATDAGSSAAPVAPLTVPVLRNLKPESAQPGTTARAPREVPLRVGLAVFEWPGQLRVLIEMADADAPSLSSREHRLWNEIALALWGREQAYTAQALPLFRFPPNARLKQMETPEAVRDAVEGFLQARQARTPVNYQYLFAGAGLAAAYLGERGALVQAPRFITTAGIPQGVLLPSLGQLMENWQLKAATWQAMVGGLQQAGLRA